MWNYFHVHLLIKSKTIKKNTFYFNLGCQLINFKMNELHDRLINESNSITTNDQCLLIYIIIRGVIHQVPDSSWRWRGSYTAPPPCLSHHPAFLSVRWWPPDPSSHPRRSSSGALRVKDRTDVRSGSQRVGHSQPSLRRYTLHRSKPTPELALTRRQENCGNKKPPAKIRCGWKI